MTCPEAGLRCQLAPQTMDSGPRTIEQNLRCLDLDEEASLPIEM